VRLKFATNYNTDNKGKLFVILFAFAPAPKTNLYRKHHPDSRICKQPNSYKLDKLLAPRELLPRHCASAHLQTPCNRDSFPAIYQHCTATLVMLNKTCTRTAKSAPYPPCTVTISRLKYQDSARCCRRVTLTPSTAGPLCAIRRLSAR
jgi:hypothetical protein